MRNLSYGFGVEVELTVEDVRSLITEALREEGFSILAEIDVSKTLKEQTGVDIPPYVILGVCNPSLAHKALEKDINIGMLLPCNVVIRQEKNHATMVSILDPLIMSRLSDAPGLEEIGLEARRRLELALGRLVDQYIE